MARTAEKYQLTYDRANYLFAYDPQSGALIRRIGRPGGGRSGDQAGTLRSDGYRSVEIDGEAYLEHLVIWLLVTGDWPEHEIDHDDRDPANNKWENLQPSSRSHNCANRGVFKNNALGVKGIRLLRGRYQARVKRNGKTLTSGGFATIREAVEARENLEKEFG